MADCDREEIKWKETVVLDQLLRTTYFSNFTKTCEHVARAPSRAQRRPLQGRDPETLASLAPWEICHFHSQMKLGLREKKSLGQGLVANK